MATKYCTPLCTFIIKCFNVNTSFMYYSYEWLILKKYPDSIFRAMHCLNRKEDKKSKGLNYHTLIRPFCIAFIVNIIIRNRLGVAWLVLYKAAVESYRLARFRVKDPVTKPPRAEIKKTWSLVLLLQAKIQALGLALPPRSGKHALTPGV